MTDVKVRTKEDVALIVKVKDLSTSLGVCNISISGRIDSTNAYDFYQQIHNIRSKHTDSALVIDVNKLEYISITGLRTFLNLYNEIPFDVINVSQKVAEVMEKTGITERMKVWKKLRKISVKNCEIIGKGANSKVYRLTDETIIKCYHPGILLSDVEKERWLARNSFIHAFLLR